MTKPLHKYTVAEASNLQVYEDYKSANVTINETDIASPDESVDWSGNPAKEVTITKVSGDDANTISIKLKIGGSYGDTITFLMTDMPVTIDRLLIDRMAFSTSDTATNEVVSLLSFH